MVNIGFVFLVMRSTPCENHITHLCAARCSMGSNLTPLSLVAPDAAAVDAIWFYCGNEANVELYVNATGLMWEHARGQNALMVFAEHRFYGVTAPAPLPDGRVRYEFLTMEQALADYDVLIRAFPQLLG